MKNKVLILSATIVLGLVGFYLFEGYPIILNKIQPQIVGLSNTTNGNFNPLEGIDFISGNGLAYLLFSREDISELPPGMKRSKLLQCTEPATLKALQNAFMFTKSDGDMATCESELFIYNDGKLIFHSAFVLTENVVGMQNSYLGWAEAVDKTELKEIFLQFKPSYQPIVKF